MRKFFLFAILTMAVSANAQVNKLLLFCDHYTPGNTNDIYIDVYVDQDLAAGTYTNMESGIVKSEKDQYPDYLWSLTKSYVADSATTSITIEKDLDALTLEFPVVPTKDATPTYAVPTTNGVVTDFNIQVSGVLNGVTVNESFICYDPTTKPAR